MKRIAFFMGMMFLLTGCGIETDGTAQKNQTEILFLNSCGSMSDADRVVRQIYSEFEAQNPDIKLQMISMPSSQKVEEKVKEMVTAGRMPNLIYMNGKEFNSLYPLLVERNDLVDLLPYINEDTELNDSIADELFSSFLTEDGKMYTLTDVVRYYGYWYNVNMFENAGIEQMPQTWEELVEDCEKISQWAKSIKYDIAPLHLDSETLKCLIEAYMADGRSENWDSENGITLLKKLSEFVPLEDDSFTWQDNIRSINMGHCAIYVGDVSQEALMNRDIKIEYSALPSQSGELTNLSSFTPGYLVCNTGTEKQKEACIRFLKYMLSESVQQRLLVDAGYIPSNPNVKVEELIQKKTRLYRTWQTVQDSPTIGKLPESVLDYYQLQDILSDIRQQLQK